MYILFLQNDININMIGGFKNIINEFQNYFFSDLFVLNQFVNVIQ